MKKLINLRKKSSSTGFRALLILNILCREPSSKEEILKELSEITSFGKTTKEMVRLDLKTLKSAGFEIINLGRKFNYKYKLNHGPINIKLTKKEIRVLDEIKNIMIDISDWEEILDLYRLFEKICSYISDYKTVYKLMNFHYFLDVDFELLKELNLHCKKRRTVVLSYNSPNSGKKEITIKLSKLKYNNSKLYLTGESPSYPNTTVLRADNIKKISKILFTPKEEEIKEEKTFVYKISSSAKDNLKLLDEEEILSSNKNFIEIKTKVENEFMVIQRLLGFGDYLVEIKDEDIKEKYKKSLKELLSVY